MFNPKKTIGFSQAFTIVELLVVVVVISILAAISIVSYNGITKKANETVLLSDLDNNSKELELYKVEKGVYPKLEANNCTSDSNTCLKVSGSNTLKYFSSPDGSAYSLIENNSASNISYYASNYSKSKLVVGSGIAYSLFYYSDDFMDFNGNLVPGVVPTGNSSKYKIVFTTGGLLGSSYNIIAAETLSWNDKQYFQLSNKIDSSKFDSEDEFVILLIDS